MASAAPGPKGMTLLINTVDKSIHSLKYGSLALDQPHTREQSRQQNSMYPGIPSNPFVVGEDDHDEHEYVDETIVSPLSPARRKSAWHPDTWSPDRFSRGHEYDAEAHGHAHSPYTSEDVEDPSKSVHFNRVKWENEREGHQPKSTISSAEEFQLPRSREVDDGLGIHITDGAGGEFNAEKASWEPTQPPPSAYRPHTAHGFEDVELNKPHEKPSLTLSKKKRACTENNFRIMLWALVLILPFVVLPLAIFGGVYHWGNAEGLCKAGGGNWDGSKHSCQY